MHSRNIKRLSRLSEKPLRIVFELIRNKRKFSFDLYKEIISNYRKLIHKMDMTQIMEYAYELPKTNMVMETIRLEIL